MSDVSDVERVRPYQVLYAVRIDWRLGEGELVEVPIDQILYVTWHGDGGMAYDQAVGLTPEGAIKAFHARCARETGRLEDQLKALSNPRVKR